MNPARDFSRIRRSLRSRAGVSLFEVLITLAVLVILAAAAIPVTSTVLAYRWRQATRDELSVLAEACGEYFRDTGAFPETPADLERPPIDDGDDAPVANWDGPYVALTGPRRPSGRSDAELDAWSRPYLLGARGDRLMLASGGADGVFGNEDDLSLELDVGWIRREETLARQTAINLAIVRYNGEHQFTAPLPPDFGALREMLVETGYLTGSSRFESDGWGAPFVEDPPGRTPVVRVRSKNLEAAPAPSPRR